MNNPLVSVIIPNYCHAKYLDQRIQSVLSQTYDNFEVIILDDCSPDGGASKAVIEKYRSNPHISHIIYNEKNSGSTFKQWHLGFEKAVGELIWIAESDDYCEIDFLKVLVHYYTEYENVGVCYCQNQIVDEEGNYIRAMLKSNDEHKYYDGHKFIKECMGFGTDIYNASMAIFKKDIALSISNEYTKYTAAGDRLFWIELAEKTNVVKVGQVMCYFRQHTNKVSPRKIHDGTTLREDYKILRYMEKIGCVNPVDRLAIREYNLRIIENHNSFASEDIRKSLIKLWSYNGLVNRKLIKRIINFYHFVRGRQPYYSDYR